MSPDDVLPGKAPGAGKEDKVLAEYFHHEVPDVECPPPEPQEHEGEDWECHVPEVVKGKCEAVRRRRHGEGPSEGEEGQGGGEGHEEHELDEE